MGVHADDKTQEGGKHTVPPEGQAGNWQPSLPLCSRAQAGHTVSPSSRERENTTVFNGKGYEITLQMMWVQGGGGNWNKCCNQVISLFLPEKNEIHGR